ncbi:hypothetical protein [Nocardia aurantiaca]|uniref:Uncharacterized protein n=1 Tax=Nocardia aurantiaca TaxID=2675850 RepID=A0A6I3KVJ8_9NOCA|nr:hypothetical protein [Nocardia aurantiaca]MTE12868.1 hypothetical protein [Nocardia aurantiaca]
MRIAVWSASAADRVATEYLRTDYSREMVVDVLWPAIDVRNSTGWCGSAVGVRGSSTPDMSSRVAGSIPTGPL